MADFLSKLAARALGVEPVVQPLVAPMYAPGPELVAGAAGSPAHDAEDATEDSAGPYAIPGAAPAAPPPALVPAWEPEVSAPQLSFHPEARPHESAVRRLPEQAGAAEEAALPGRPRRIVPEERPALPRALVDPLTGVPDEVSLPSGAWLGSDSQQRPRLLVPIDLPPKQPTRRRTQSPVPYDLPTEEPEPTAPPAGRGPDLRAEETPPDEQLLIPTGWGDEPALPQPTSAGEQHRRGSEEQGEPPGPAIHITIGRVEVRAVMQTPSPPAASASPPPPRLSLDEYLRLQYGGSS